MLQSLPNRIDQADVAGKRVLVRTDLGEALSPTGQVSEHLLRETLPTLQLLQERGAACVLLASTPGQAGTRAPVLKPVAEALSEILGGEVPLRQLPAAGSALSIQPGEALLVENLARHRGEMQAETAFTKRLVEQAELFVNDAPEASNGEFASVVGVAGRLESYAGLRLHRDLEVLLELLTRRHKDVALILGGTKLPEAIALCRKMFSGFGVRNAFLGGGIAYTFLRSRAIPVGRSMFDGALQVDAFQIIERSELADVELHLPLDHVIGERFSADTKAKTVNRMNIPEDWTALDIGPKTTSAIEKGCKKAGAVFWHGPLGATELDKFGKGTVATAKALGKSRAVTIVAGHSLVSFLKDAGLADGLSHCMGSSQLALSILKGSVPPGVAALFD